MDRWRLVLHFVDFGRLLLNKIPKNKTSKKPTFNLISFLFCRYEKGDNKIIESGLITFCDGQKDACLDIKLHPSDKCEKGEMLEMMRLLMSSSFFVCSSHMRRLSPGSFTD